MKKFRDYIVHLAYYVHRFLRQLGGNYTLEKVSQYAVVTEIYIN